MFVNYIKIKMFFHYVIKNKSKNIVKIKYIFKITMIYLIIKIYEFIALEVIIYI